MRTTTYLVMLLVSALFGFPDGVAAQPVPGPVIQSVILSEDTSVITITGTGLGADVVVTVDGQAVTPLPGANSTRVEVQTPVTVLSAPGTYRLTVVDPAKRVGDTLVVTSKGVSTYPGVAAFSGTLPAAAGATTRSPRRSADAGPLVRGGFTVGEWTVATDGH